MTPSSITLGEQPPARPSTVLLIGMMGSGKTHVGSLVASRLGWPHLDSDQQIQLSTGTTVAQIFAQRGEAAFRAEESRVLRQAVTAEGPVVVSVAGGAVLSGDNQRLLRRAGFVVWLRAEVATLAQRVEGADHRPLLNGDRRARLTALYAERRLFYQELADVVIDVDHLTPSEVADQVMAAYSAWRAHLTRATKGGDNA
jgi:shikimate kinase